MMNPILERELKTRMRTGKTPILLLVYLALIGMVVAIAFLAEYSNHYYGFSGFAPAFVTGIYVAISLFQLGILMFILPVFTATSITGERERQTIDLLLCTDISPWSIILGKMSAALVFVFLLIFAALPFTGVILLFGGVTIFDLIKVMLFFMATALMVSSIGMFCTTHFKKNISSIVMSYVIYGAILSLPMIGMSILSIIVQASYNSANYQQMQQFLEKYSYELLMLTFMSNPFYGATSLLTSGTMGSDIFYMFNGIGRGSTILRYVSPWAANLVFFLIITVLALVLSKRKLTKLK